VRSETVSAFWASVQNDAAVQERVVQASRQSNPLQAILNIARSAGFHFTSDQLRESLTPLPGENEFGRVAGSAAMARVAGLRAPGEWFAEVYSALVKTG
jgi:predicted ribosomally synthesized peptide with nif11-like leader